MIVQKTIGTNNLFSIIIRNAAKEFNSMFGETIY